MQLLQEVYPGLLDSSRPQKVEIFVPFNHKLVASDPLPQVREDEVFGSGDDDQQPNHHDNHHVIASASPDSNTPPSILGGSSPMLPAGQGSGASQSVTTPPSVLGGSGSTGVNVAPGQGGQGPSHQSSSSSSSSGGHIADLFRRLGEGAASPLGITPPSSRGALFSDHSWEVVSKYSTTSNRLSILQDQSDPDYDLVPLWECLQVYSHVINSPLCM